ncbi:MAG TPA: winged helix DNA-binding domain-containing protein [Gaiellaceae bacterium]
MRTLSLRELNRATLARQLLLERRRLPLISAIERVAGLQGQWGPAPYVGLWTRVDGFRRETLERALLRQQVVRAVLMRGTVHLVSARDYGVFGAGVGDPPWVKPEVAAAAGRLHEEVRAFGAEPRTRNEVLDWLREEQGVDGEAPGLWYALRTRGRLTHTGDSGAWKTPRTTTYVALQHEPADPESSRVELVRRYLAAFGPATRADVAEWSGVRVRDFEPALEALEPLRRFRDERGRQLLDLPRAPLPSPDAPAPVRFLPRFDNLVLSHADRTRVLPEAYRSTVIYGAGQVEATFLVDGFVAGVWSVEKGRVRVEPFAPLPRTAKREVEDEAGRLEEWLR